MINLKIYQVIGIMTGTSMDGLDFSLIKTDGDKYVKVIIEKSYQYSPAYRKELKDIISNLPSKKKEQINYANKKDLIITNKILKLTKNFIKYTNLKNTDVDLIGLSGQTIIHNPKNKYSIQLGSGKLLSKILKIPTVSDFRINDLLNGGQGAPIGTYYHKYILEKINKNAAIINLGGIANITYAKKNNLISFDMGIANALIDDLSMFFFNQRFDKNGIHARKGKPLKNILDNFKKDSYFKKKYPKSLDRDYFKKYFTSLKKFDPKDSLHTATLMIIFGILNGLDLLRKFKIDIIIFSGGGRKNLFLIDMLKTLLKKKGFLIKNIDLFNLNGDFIESQMFAYLAVRSIKKKTISSKYTTGSLSKITGGKLYKEF